MFEEIPFMIGFMIFAPIISYLLRTYTPRPLDKIIIGISIFGVIIHELSHALICFLTNTKIEKITLVKKLDDEKKFTSNNNNYGGHIRLTENRFSFLQAVLTGFAPLYISFWIFFFLLDQLINHTLEILVAIIYIFIMLSLIFAAAPSSTDISNIPNAFSNDIPYSFYQIFLLILSVLTSWFTFYLIEIKPFHEIVFYLICFIFYYCFKYSFLLVTRIFLRMRSRHNLLNNHQKARKRNQRRRHKPINPKKVGIEEPQW